MCDRMLQDSLRCYRGFGPGCGVGIQGPGAGWGGDSGPVRGGVGFGGPGAATWWGDSGPARDGVEIFGVRWEIFYLFAVFRRLGRDLH